MINLMVLYSRYMRKSGNLFSIDLHCFQKHVFWTNPERVLTKSFDKIESSIDDVLLEFIRFITILHSCHSFDAVEFVRILVVVVGATYDEFLHKFFFKIGRS